MDSASAWRLEFARSRVAPAYAASSNVGAVFVAGSVARNLADRFSDVELHVFWKSAPSYEERIAMATAVGASIEVRGDQLPSPLEQHRVIAATSGSFGTVWPREAEEWSDLYFVDGVYLDVSGFLCEQVEGYLKGLERLRQSPGDSSAKNPLLGADGELAEMLVAAIEDGIPLHGKDLGASWKSRCSPYPAGLAAAVVKRNLFVEKDWWAIDQIVAREERLLTTELLATMQRKVMRILLGLNRVYLTDVRLKWVKQLCERMAWSPAQLPERLNRLHQIDLATAAHEMEAILEDVWSRVDSEFPEIDPALRDRWFRYRRPAPEGPPDASC